MCARVWGVSLCACVCAHLLNEIGGDICEVIVPHDALMGVGPKETLEQGDQERGGTTCPGCVRQILCEDVRVWGCVGVRVY